MALPYSRDATPWTAVADIARRGGDFVISGAVVRSAPQRGTFSLRFKCAPAFCRSSCLRTLSICRWPGGESHSLGTQSVLYARFATDHAAGTA